MYAPPMARIGPGPDPVGHLPPTVFDRKLKLLVEHDSRKQNSTLRSVASGLEDRQEKVTVTLGMLLDLLVAVVNATARPGWAPYTPPIASFDCRTPYSAAGFVPVFSIRAEHGIASLLHEREMAVRESARWAPSVNVERCCFAPFEAKGSYVARTCGSWDRGWAASLGSEAAECTDSGGSSILQVPDGGRQEIGHCAKTDFFTTSAVGGSATTRVLVSDCRCASAPENPDAASDGLNRPRHRAKSEGDCPRAGSRVHCCEQESPKDENNFREILVSMTDWELGLPTHDTGDEHHRSCLTGYLAPSVIPSLSTVGHSPAAPYSDDPGVNLEGYIDSLNPKGPSNLNGNVTKSVRGWIHGYAPGRTAVMHQQMDDLIEQHRDSGFSWSLKDLGCYTGPLGPVAFPLEDENKRFYAHPRRSPFHEKIVEDEKVPPLIEAGIVVEVPAAVAASKYASNSVVAWKKDSEGAYTEKRYCHNYKPINTGLLSTSARLPRIDQLLADVSKARYYSRLDCRMGFMALPVVEKDQPKTAFWYNRKLYMYKFMPFGLKTAPTLFQERMERAIEDAGLSHCCCVYIDDCLCYSDTWEQHLQDVNKTISMIKGIGMKCHPGKSVFGAEVIEFLGHNLSNWGTSPTEAKVDAIKALPEPSDLHTLRRVLGFLQYYRCYCPNFSAIASVLTALTRKDAPWTWRPLFELAAYQRLKDLICEPGRAIRHADPTKPYILHTDWSKHGIGAVLGQIDDDGNEYIVACVSRSLNKAEREYASYKGEMLGAVYSVKALDYYLRGAKFTLVTDHAPLVYLMTSDNLHGQYARWSLILQEYDFTIKHRPGDKHQNADALSRHPKLSSEDNTGARLDHDKPVTVAEAHLAYGSYSRACLAGYIFPEEEWGQTSGDIPDQTKTEQGLVACGMLSRLLCEQPFQDNALTFVGSNPESADPKGRVATCSHAMHLLIHELHKAAGSTAATSAFLDAYGAPDDRFIYGEPDNSDFSSQIEALHPERTSRLRHSASAWVANCIRSLQAQLLQAAPTQPAAATEAGTIDHTVLPATTVLGLPRAGITLYEPFGGLCAGLEMALRNGFQVQHYLYSDTDLAAQKVMQHRIRRLSELYGSHLLPPTAYNHLMGPLHAPGPHENRGRVLPMDVAEITEQHLIDAGALDGGQWFVVAGWECQDLSPAGSGRGLTGSRSGTYYPLMGILSTLQRLQPCRPPVYIVENTAMQVGKHAGKLAGDFDTICNQLGAPVLLDAARVGAGAHRLRNYWTNLADSAHIMTVLETVHRDPSVTLQDTVLGPGRSPQSCRKSTMAPMYSANVHGEGLRVLPTLMATVNSYAFRDGGLGMVIDDTTGKLVPLTIEERERALGYATGCTDAPALGSGKAAYIARHQITGRCMDARAMMYLLAVGIAIRAALHTQPLQPFRTSVNTSKSAAMSASSSAGGHVSQPVVSTPSASQQLGGEENNPGTPELFNFSTCCDSETPACVYWRNVAAATVADVQERILSVRSEPAVARPEAELRPTGRVCISGGSLRPPSEGGPSHTYAGLARGTIGGEPAAAAGAPDPTYIADVWLDEPSLKYIKVQEFSPADLANYSLSEKKRIIARCKSYYMVAGRLYRRMPDGEAKEVPPPSERTSVITGIHDQTGHFGRRRTTYMLMLRYWWAGMYNDVRRAISLCPSCSRVTSSNFGAMSPELQPLPIMGMFYRWHVDLAGPFPVTARGHTYVMVCVEAFSKHAELIPITSKHSDVTAHAFLHNVLARFGACAEVVTDQGNEWDSEFYELLTDCFIDHRRTSANRPQSNGLAERCVQTLKTCLRKQITGRKGGSENWDKLVAWVALGYRVTPHESTKMAPYQMLYAVSPIIPPNIKARLKDPVSIDGSVRSALEIARRSEEVQRSCIIAGWNATIAQHRDTLRYAKLRSGAYLPKLKRYEVGDYVYVKYRTKPNTLQPQVRPEILRILQVRHGKDGHQLVLRLEGRDGRTIDEHFSNCVPCHLPIESETLRLGKVPVDYHCQQCGFPDDGRKLLMCDRCDRGWHMYCLEPKLESVPEGNWYCDACAQHPDVTDAQQPIETQRMTPMAVPADQLVAGPSRSEAKKRKKVSWALPLTVASVPAAPGVERKGSNVMRWSPVSPDDNPPVNPASVPASGPNRGRAGRAIRFPHVQPTTGPEGSRVNPVAASTYVTANALLPQYLQLDTSEGVMNALQMLMPGPWTAELAARIVAKCLRAGPTSQVSSQQVPEERECVMAGDMQCLMDAIDFGCINSVTDMFAGKGNVGQELGMRVTTNDINSKLAVDYHHDALQPETYWSIRQRHGMDAIVSSPCFAVLDLALPLAVKFAHMVVCCHVPGHYLTDAPEARAQWLQSLQWQGRLFFIMGVPRGPMGRRSVWLVIFRTQAIGEWMRRPYAGFSTLLHHAFNQEKEKSN